MTMDSSKPKVSIMDKFKSSMRSKISKDSGAQKDFKEMKLKAAAANRKQEL